MLSTGAAIGSFVGTIIFFVILTLAGVYMNRSLYKDQDSEAYLMARNSQSTLALSLSFFASGAGAWVLFTVPEAAILGGPVAVAGYTISCMLPLAIFGLIGPYFRRELPKACTFFDYLQARYGFFVNAYCTLVSLFYMFLYLSAELTSVGSCIVSLSELKDPLGPVFATSLVTLAYTSVGGMPVSLLTDKVQGVGVFFFTILVCAAGFGFYTLPTSPDANPEVVANWKMVTTWGLGGTAGNSFKMAVILISAVTCANLMHSGFQQRVWAAQGDAQIWRGAVGGMLLTAPLMALFGVLGMISFANYGIPGLVAVGDEGVYLAFLAAFFLVGAMAPVWQAFAIVLAVMMVASSADTIQTGVAALLKPITERALNAASPGAAGNTKLLVGVNFLIAAVLVNVPAIALSTAGVSVLTLFVMADLVCASAVVPVLLGLSPRIHHAAAAAGCIAGFASAAVIMAIGMPSAVTGKSENVDPVTGDLVPMKMLVEPGGLYSQTSFVAFLVVPAVSGLVTMLANIPFHLRGYRFPGFNVLEEPSPEVADNGQPKEAAA
mmetsp:Transcript_103326/g.287629  ORF Transcript_103326/g.287629 Transcript_103326/m.287629 type:complete len:549 (-) Transcript_103326:256-1902(-)